MLVLRGIHVFRVYIIIVDLLSRQVFLRGSVQGRGTNPLQSEPFLFLDCTVRILCRLGMGNITPKRASV